MELKEEIIRLIKLVWGILFSLISSLLLPVCDFMIVIIVLATLNIFFGLAEDKYCWSFKKAFKSFVYLIGYLFLLALIVIVGRLMHVEPKEISEFTSWVTWVMIWFYGTNILKNWNTIQPENKVIAFLYWVVSFKIVEKIKFIKEFNEKENLQ